MSAPQSGTVHSFTTINFPGRAHAADAPFVLVLVDTGAPRHVLGHFAVKETPPIGARVAETGRKDDTPVFSLMQGPS
jgi:uncharacterized OB-fold protein